VDITRAGLRIQNYDSPKNKLKDLVLVYY
jgi:hypothetical protein